MFLHLLFCTISSILTCAGMTDSSKYSGPEQPLRRMAYALSECRDDCVTCEPGVNSHPAFTELDTSCQYLSFILLGHHCFPPNKTLFDFK